jgi:hypothetical protein
MEAPVFEPLAIQHRPQNGSNYGEREITKDLNPIERLIAASARDDALGGMVEM